MSQNSEFKNVTAVTKANIYFDGKVVSHTIIEANGQKKTLGLIYPGTYSFNTGAPELMIITSGNCEVKLAGQNESQTYSEGTKFNVPGNSSFEISVKEGIAEYICAFEA